MTICHTIAKGIYFSSRTFRYSCRWFPALCCGSFWLVHIVCEDDEIGRGSFRWNFPAYRSAPSLKFDFKYYRFLLQFNCRVWSKLFKLKFEKILPKFSFNFLYVLLQVFSTTSETRNLSAFLSLNKTKPVTN